MKEIKTALYKVAVGELPLGGQGDHEWDAFLDSLGNLQLSQSGDMLSPEYGDNKQWHSSSYPEMTFSGKIYWSDGLGQRFGDMQNVVNSVLKSSPEFLLDGLDINQMANKSGHDIQMMDGPQLASVNVYDVTQLKGSWWDVKVSVELKIDAHGNMYDPSEESF